MNDEFKNVETGGFAGARIEMMYSSVLPLSIR
jgi:hypothetical protein